MSIKEYKIKNVKEIGCLNPFHTFHVFHIARVSQCCKCWCWLMLIAWSVTEKYWQCEYQSMSRLNRFNMVQHGSTNFNQFQQANYHLFFIFLHSFLHSLLQLPDCTTPLRSQALAAPCIHHVNARVNTIRYPIYSIPEDLSRSHSKWSEFDFRFPDIFAFHPTLLVESNTLQAELRRQEMQSQEVDHRKHDQSLGAKSSDFRYAIYDHSLSLRWKMKEFKVLFTLTRLTR